MLLVEQVLKHPAVLVGYARVSTGDQTLGLQRDASDKAGSERVFTDVLSGSKSVRPGLDELLAFVRNGDTLVVWRLGRLGRSLPHLIETVTTLPARGVGFRSLTEAIDTTTTGGKLIFHFFGALAAFERDVIRERTNAGLAAARARGRTGGRPKAISDPKKIELARRLYADKSNHIETICSTLGMRRSLLYRIVKVPEKVQEMGGSSAHSR